MNVGAEICGVNAQLDGVKLELDGVKDAACWWTANGFEYIALFAWLVRFYIIFDQLNNLARV